LSTKPHYLMPDAMTVIHLHEIRLWVQVCGRIGIVVPSIIVHREAYYYVDPETDEYRNFDLLMEVAEKRITQRAAPVADMSEFLDHFDSSVRPDLHEGELEALTLLWKGVVQDCRLCSADRTAVTALVLMGMKELGMSLETALQQIGLSSNRIKPQFSEERFQQWVTAAEQRRMLGQGLVKDPFQ